jgi:uroporphyrinogen III methyltransferase/synthase
MAAARPGKVYLVGAGPGDPELLTLKGKRCLETADVILFDELANHDLLEFADANAESIDVGKTPGKHCTGQREIEALLISHARQGKTVVRLKGGDPFVFGRGGEEALALRAAGIPYEVVPGISSAIAVPAYAGIPVTHRGRASSFAVVSGHNASRASVDWAGLVRAADTLVILMGLGNLAVIMDRLLEGRCEPERPVALIQSGTRGRQQVVAGTVGTIAGLARQANLTSPATIVVGVVVRLAEQLDWFPSIASPAVGDPNLASGPLELAASLPG